MFDYEVGLDLHKRNPLLSVIDSNGKRNLSKINVTQANGANTLFFLDKLLSLYVRRYSGLPVLIGKLIYKQT